MLNTGLVSVTFRDKTPEEIISTVKQCGLEGIEWGGDVHVLPGDVSRAREIRHLTEQATWPQPLGSISAMNIIRIR